MGYHDSFGQYRPGPCCRYRSAPAPTRTKPRRPPFGRRRPRTPTALENGPVDPQPPDDHDTSAPEAAAMIAPEERPADLPFLVVGVGGSAGSLEAFKEIM